MSVTVEYTTQTLYCSCCNQPLKEAKVSEVQKALFTVETAESWSDAWPEIVKYPEDMDDIIADFVYETISFWAVDSNRRILIEDGEYEKVKQLILSEIPPAPDEDEDDEDA